MESVQMKSNVSSSRRSKYVIVGLLAVICVLSFNIYKSHIYKKELVRRKTFLIMKLRQSKTVEEKLSQALGEKTVQNTAQKEKLTVKQEQLDQRTSELQKLTNSYNKQVHQFLELKKSASASQESLHALKKQYENASSTIKVMKDNLERAFSSCDHVKDNNKALKQDISSKEKELEQCMQDKDALSRKNKDQADKYKRRVNLLSRRQPDESRTKEENPAVTETDRNKLQPTATARAPRSTSPLSLSRSGEHQQPMTTVNTPSVTRQVALSTRLEGLALTDEAKAPTQQPNETGDETQDEATEPTPHTDDNVGRTTTISGKDKSQTPTKSLGGQDSDESETSRSNGSEVEADPDPDNE